VQYRIDSTVVLRGHKLVVRTAVFSPDGKTVATASADGAARLWEVPGGRQIAVLESKNNVHTAVFSGDGKRLLTCSDEPRAHLWEARTGRKVAVLPGAERWVTSGAFSPDSKMVVTIDPDKSLRIFDADTGRLMRTIKSPPRGQTKRGRASMAFSPDGRRIVVGGDDWNAGIVEVGTGKMSVRIEGKDGRVTSVCFSPTGRKILTTSWTKGLIRIWDAANGRQVALLNLGEISRPRSSPDPGVETFWVVPDLGKSNWPSSAVFSRDGNKVLTGARDGTVALWCANTGKKLSVFKGHRDQARKAIFSPDGSKVLSASDDETARLWDARTGRLLLTLTGHGDSLTSCAFSPDGKRIVTSSWDKTARIWTLASGQGRQAK